MRIIRGLLPALVVLLIIFPPAVHAGECSKKKQGGAHDQCLQEREQVRQAQRQNADRQRQAESQRQQQQQAQQRSQEQARQLKLQRQQAERQHQPQQQDRQEAQRRALDQARQADLRRRQQEGERSHRDEIARTQAARQRQQDLQRQAEQQRQQDQERHIAVQREQQRNAEIARKQQHERLAREEAVRIEQHRRDQEAIAKRNQEDRGRAPTLADTGCSEKLGQAHNECLAGRDRARQDIRTREAKQREDRQRAEREQKLRSAETGRRQQQERESGSINGGQRAGANLNQGGLPKAEASKQSALPLMGAATVGGVVGVPFAHWSDSRVEKLLQTGHTYSRHIGFDERQLAERLTREPNLRYASSFSDEKAAKAATRSALSQHESKIRIWMQQAKQGAKLEIEHQLEKPYGIVLRRGAIKAAESATVRAVLVRTAAATTEFMAEDAGFILLTAFLL